MSSYGQERILPNGYTLKESELDLKPVEWDYGSDQQREDDSSNASKIIPIIIFMLFCVISMNVCCYYDVMSNMMIMNDGKTRFRHPYLVSDSSNGYIPKLV